MIFVNKIFDRCSQCQYDIDNVAQKDVDQIVIEKCFCCTRAFKRKYREGKTDNFISVHNKQNTNNKACDSKRGGLI